MYVKPPISVKAGNQPKIQMGLEMDKVDEDNENESSSEEQISQNVHEDVISEGNSIVED